MTTLFLIVVLFTLCACIAGLNVGRNKEPHPVAMPLNRRTLFRIINGRYIWDYAKVTLPLLAVIWFVYEGGRIDLGTAIASSIVVMMLLSLALVPATILQMDMWRAIRSRGDFDALFANKTLYFEDGSWWYMDEKWLICAGFCSACALHAPDIDFSAGIRHESHGWYLVHGAAYIRCIAFRYKSGKNGRMMAALNEKILGWFEEHKNVE